MLAANPRRSPTRRNVRVIDLPIRGEIKKPR